MGTVLISLLLLAIVAAIIRYMVKLKKAGKSPCGIGCSPPAIGWGVLSLPAPRKKRPTKVGRSPINAFCLTLCLTQQ